MSLKQLPLTQYEIECRIDDLIPHGEKVALAEFMGVSPGRVSQMLNPHDDQPSWFFKTLQAICGLDQSENETGEKVWQEMSRIRQSWRTARTRRSSTEPSISRVCDEMNELIKISLEGEPHPAQISAIVNAIEALQNLKTSLINSYNEQHFADKERKLKAV